MRVTTYRNAPNSTDNAPSSPTDGAPLDGGARIYAECLSMTVSTGTDALKVSLHSTRRGARALVEAGPGATITGGTIRWWVRDPSSGEWHASVDVSPLTGVRRIATPDEFVAVFGEEES